MTDKKITDKEIKTLFIVENGLNTCYIDSLLMALFYKPSTYLDNLLITEPKDPNYIYLQSIIKLKFVDVVRKNISITADVINEIRIFSNICGWKYDMPDELTEQQDVNEFYTFLMDKMNTPLIEIQRQTISEALTDKNDIGSIEKIPFINLHIQENENETSIKELLNIWMNHNPIDVNREIIDDVGIKRLTSVKALNVYRIVNVPMFIGLSLNRFPGGKRLDTMIDIQKKIKLYQYDSQDGLRWRIHSVICHKGETPKAGHYYSALFDGDNSWLLFDDQSIPSLKEVNIKDTEISDTIKREAVFAIYTYDETI